MKTRDTANQEQRDAKRMSADPTTRAPKREGRAAVAAVGRFSAKGFGTLWLAWSDAPSPYTAITIGLSGPTLEALGLGQSFPSHLGLRSQSR